MNPKRLARLTVLAGLALVVGLGTAGGQQTPPTENKGMKAPVVASLDLGQEIDGMQGRQLRMRVITLEPGGVVQGRVIVADGYHRLCAVYSYDEDAVIPCKIV